MANINRRFPFAGLLENFKIFNTKEFQKLDVSELEFYGTKEINAILYHFCTPKYVNQQKHTFDQFNRNDILNEWNKIKTYLYKNYKEDSTLTAWGVTAKFIHESDKRDIKVRLILYGLIHHNCGIPVKAKRSHICSIKPLSLRDKLREEGPLICFGLGLLAKALSQKQFKDLWSVEGA